MCLKRLLIISLIETPYIWIKVPHLVFGVQHHGLCVWHSHHVVVKGGGRQPHPSWQLVVEQ